MTGWHGRLLEVDLDLGTVRAVPLDPSLLATYLGGRGLGVRLLRDDFRRDPLDPSLPLIFAVGPLCGSGAPASARLSVVSRSPLTGTIYDGSSGGPFALRLKAAGFDAVRVVGRSPRPVVLAITPQGGELLDASALWGERVGSTLRALAGRGSVAAIGPAGEAGVRYAAIGLDGGAIERGGLGAVMGAKHLKALVVAGDRPTLVADPQRLAAAGADVLRLFRASPVLCGELGLGVYGTLALVDLLAQRRMTPTENFRHTWFAGTAAYSGPALSRAYAPRGEGCGDCPVHCRQRGADGEVLPGYEAASHFGALLGNADPTAIVHANTLCSELGLDPVSAAATLAAWGEARGRFPGPEEFVPLLEAIAAGTGEGALLGEGAARVAAQMGRPELAMTVKGLELPAYDPRGAYGLALAYATCNRGGCHLCAYPIGHEILRKPVPTERFSFAGKARMVKIAEDSIAAIDSLGVCRFALLAAGLEEYAALYAAVSGEAVTAGELQMAGERVFLAERCYNAGNGFTAADDDLPQRFFLEPGSSGLGIAVPPLDRARFLEERGKYYRMRGLTENGAFLDPHYLERQP